MAVWWYGFREGRYGVCECTKNSLMPFCLCMFSFSFVEDVDLPPTPYSGTLTMPLTMTTVVIIYVDDVYCLSVLLMVDRNSFA